jgi:hypothetical protein
VFCLLVSAFWLLGTAEVIALPPPEDLPEEILRTEIITEARSPIDGQPLTAAEYAQLQTQQPELWAGDDRYSGNAIACPPQDFLPCVSDRDPQEGGGAFSATNHIINKLPIRYLLRQMFPF